MAEPVRRRRAIQWIWHRQDDWPEWMVDSRLFDAVSTLAARLGCWRRGHQAQRDQCGRSEHDHCAWCMRPMPGQWSRESSPW